ncbi:MAG: tRNA dihydrouridine synthase DusB [candidate division Zixibacteria bacterium]|nr:tRNA dihydrouridine synthase DusB [candidate division Zixibacteria bacterium]
MRIGNLNLKGQVLAAPLAGISNRPFRVLAVGWGAALTYTEMVSSEGIIRHQKKTLALMEFQSDEQPIGIQLFGANPEVMGQAAAIVREQFCPDLIDLNFGCPVKKVVRKNGGAAVLKDLVLTEEIIRAVVEAAGEIPVTIKIRSGWDDENPVYIEAGIIARKAGAAAVTLHARSRSRGFAGEADWLAIKKLKNAIDIPVIGNGDIKTPLDARRMIDQTACDAVMIGRVSFGNPFIFGRVDHYLKTGELLPEPSVTDKIELALEHAELMVGQYGETRGAKMMRRYLGWYVKGWPGATELRPRLFQVETRDDIKQVFDDYLEK